MIKKIFLQLKKTILDVKQCMIDNITILKLKQEAEKKVTDSAVDETLVEGFSAKFLTGEQDKHSKLLKASISDSSIYNIALSGPYGSGKTSIIKTFKHNYDLNYIDISLATFDDKFTKKDNTSNLEYCILKQLFYKVHPDKVPESRFKRIVNHKCIGFYAFLFFCWLITIFYFTDNILLNTLIEALGLNFYSSFFNGLYSLIAFSGLGMIVYKMYDFFINFKMTKFRVNEAEMESKAEKATLNFENEIDEILYFFERNPVDVVFFEDLDRFNNTEIYIKLREINFLINNYDPIKETGKVTFVYAVIDDIFTQNERTKFFDFILPVVPVINYTNSAIELIKRFENEINSIEDEKERRDFKGHIEKVSLYLTDMRVIISIANEYKVYKSILNKGIDPKKLFAMMVYKNLEPTDFDSLDNREGYVYGLLKNKKSFTETTIKEIEHKLTENNKLIDAASEELAINLNELKSIYISKFIQIVNERQGHGVSNILLSGKSLKFLDLLSEENFKLFTEITTTTYNYYGGGSTSISLRFKEIEKLVNPNISYSNRVEKIQNKATKRDEELRTKSQTYENQIKDLSSKKLYELLNEFDGSKYFENRKAAYETFVKEKKKLKVDQIDYNYDLINYFATEGYIDEDFEHYISRQDGNLSKEDREFLLSFNSKALAFDVQLKELSSLLTKIDDTYFYKDQILNFSLLDYLFENRRNNQINKILTVLSRETDTAMRFIDEYLSYTSEVNKNLFFEKITNSWNNIFNYILNKTNFPFEKKSFYIRMIFKVQSLPKIKELNREKSIGQFLTPLETLDPIFFDDSNKAKVMEFLKSERLYFENLKYEKRHYELFKFIYENNFYEINFSMLKLMIQTFKSNDVDIKKLEFCNYTIIQDSGCEAMKKYIDYEIEYYCENVWFQLEQNDDESEKNILHIVNDLTMPEEIAVRILKQNKTVINSIFDIKEKSLWKEIFDAKKLKISWTNLLEYFKEFKEIDPVLVDYLNEVDVFEKLGSMKITESNQDIKQDFVTKLILSNIHIESFKNLINIVENIYIYNEVNELEESKIQILTENEIIEFSIENFNEINADHEAPAIRLSEIHKSEFFESIEDLELTGTNISSILKSECFTDAEKVELINLVNEEIIVNHRKTLLDVFNFLLRQPLTKLTDTLVIALLNSDASLSDRVSFFNKYYNPSLELEKLNARFTSLGYPYDNLIKGRNTINLPDTPENNQFYTSLRGRTLGEKKLIDGVLRIWQKGNKF